MVLPWSTCVVSCVMARLLDGVKVAHCVAVGGRREPRLLDGVGNARVSPGIACGRCYGTCATIATLRRPSSVDAAILRGALLRSCLAGRATRGTALDTSALATPASIVILATVLRIVNAARQQGVVSSLCSSMTRLSSQRPRQSARTGVIALLYRSVYRIKEPRQQPNEDSQRGPRRRPPIPRVKRTQVNISKMMYRPLWWESSCFVRAAARAPSRAAFWQSSCLQS